MTEVKVRGQGWCMYPELHEQVLRDLQTVSLSHSFHHEDDYSGCIKDYDTKIMGTFRCQHNRCRGSQWSSKHIAITIRLYEGGMYNARVLSQLCGLCKNATRPQPDQTYVSRIAYRLKKWSGLDVEAPPYTKRSDESFNDRNLCQGCKHGHCNGRHFQMNFP
ncbi:hypothetical protein E8E14_007143 [Neopestalotiopsis sp. 37M]|nr:hypothetical protein E8E14_007143 [Neopestalotiopsis sp. 37M]